MARAVDGLSTSAPSGRQGTGETPTEFGPCIFSPGGYSYGATASGSSNSENKTKRKTLKTAKGTGRTIGKSPNQSSYNKLVEEAERTGAEIRM